MKVEFTEHEGCFEVALEPESMEEIVALARFGMNRTEKIQSAGAEFYQDGKARGSIVIKKKKNGSSFL